MRGAVALSLGLMVLAGPAFAAEDQAAQAARWDELKHALFGERPVVEDSNVVGLEAPHRALDAALVPLTVTLPGASSAESGRIKTVWIVVDGNPSPVAGAFHFGAAADPRLLKTRVRVEEYTLIHAVAETEDGRLFATVKYVKATGGCAAPSTKDPQLAMTRLGQMKLRLEGGQAPIEGKTVLADLLISHPNNNGMQMDQLTHNYIPPRYIQDIKVTYGSALVMSVDADISLSEDPVISFGLKLDGDGPLRVEMEDSTHAVFHHDFDLMKRS